MPRSGYQPNAAVLNMEVRRIRSRLASVSTTYKVGELSMSDVWLLVGVGSYQGVNIDSRPFTEDEVSALQDLERRIFGNNGE